MSGGLVNPLPSCLQALLGCLVLVELCAMAMLLSGEGCPFGVDLLFEALQLGAQPSALLLKKIAPLIDCGPIALKLGRARLQALQLLAQVGVLLARAFCLEVGVGGELPS